MVELIVRGGFFMVPVLVCSVLAVAVFVERLVRIVQAGRLVQALAAEAAPLLDAGDLAALRDLVNGRPGPLAAACRAGLGAPLSFALEGMRSEASYQVTQMGRGLRAMATIAHIAPLLGLLGTVSGMINAFRDLQAEAERIGGMVGPNVLAGGIWEALLTTAAGLAVAIPVFVGHAFLVARVDGMATEMERVCGRVVETRQARARALLRKRRADSPAEKV